MTLPKEKLDLLEKAVTELSHKAEEAQSGLRIRTKKDGSPVTQIDMMVSNKLMKTIASLFPDAAIISEEHSSLRKEDAPCTFVIDPIDGTDVYSQGFPSWCVSVGILDEKHQPVGAMICAPRFGIATSGSLTVRLDPGGDVLVDGKLFSIPCEKETLGQIMVSSSTLKSATVERFPGKIRCYGSMILHLLCPVLIPKVHASVQSSGYIWDYASAHAVLRNMGMDIFRGDGKPFVYDEKFLKRRGIREILYAGKRECVEQLRTLIVPRRSHEEAFA